jgi:DinB superfamily
MKKQLTHVLLLAIASTTAIAQAGASSSNNPKGSTDSSGALRALLISDLRSTHNQPEWFLPLSTSVGGLTPEQAKWIPTNSAGKINPNANHSVGMIANHILFWDRNALAQMKAEPTTSPNTNDETFNDFTPANWAKIVRDLDTVMNSLEQLVQQADPATLLRIAPTIERISTHNAYHTGQIFYVRKLQGTWKLDNDVR